MYGTTCPEWIEVPGDRELQPLRRFRFADVHAKRGETVRLTLALGGILANKDGIRLIKARSIDAACVGRVSVALDAKGEPRHGRHTAVGVCTT